MNMFLCLFARTTQSDDGITQTDEDHTAYKDLHRVTPLSGHAGENGLLKPAATHSNPHSNLIIIDASPKSTKTHETLVGDGCGSSGSKASESLFLE